MGKQKKTNQPNNHSRIAYQPAGQQKQQLNQKQTKQSKEGKRKQTHDGNGPK
jgi:hypothetical protein